jgi:uncharacterized protein (TIGR02246 family)
MPASINRISKLGAAMKLLFSAALFMSLCVPAFAQEAREVPVRQSIEAFYSAFGQGFVDGAGAFATEDWNHINPFGGRTRGRDAVLKEVVAVHATFLKGVTDTIDTVDVRFASPDVAVATVTSHMSPFVTPDGIAHDKDRPIRTFVMVRRAGRWLIMQDQNTNISQ